ncbi:MAG: glycosyltransferase family 2 protein [Polyangiaceae bacterium]|nr:glycosyltransferase family 2 protein [Polyangiaceae bacterium]
MTAARVSVIIPTYNYGRYVAGAVERALAQEVPGGVEVIVVDDGSTDDTPIVMARLTARYERVRYVRQQNRREGAARNNGASRAAGEYLAFLDPDDYYLPGQLAADVARFEATDRPALVYSRALNVDPDDRPLGVRRLASPQGDIFWALARESFIPMSTVTVRAEAFRACGGFVEDPDLSGTADWELWLRICARWPAGFVDQAATGIRVHPHNMSRDPAWMERAMLAGVRHALADPVVARRAAGREAEIWSHMYVTIALNAYANGAPVERVRPWLARALRTCPRQALDPRFLGGLARAMLGRDAVGRVGTLVRAGRTGVARR